MSYVDRLIDPRGILAVATALASLVLAAPATVAPDSPDSSFSGDGRATTDFGELDLGEDVVVQDDGKIVSLGTNFSSFLVTRHNPGGSLDQTFAGDGRQAIGMGFGFGYALAIQPDGKLVVAGQTQDSRRFAVARLKTNGGLDPRFSGDGRQTVAFPGYRNNVGAEGVAIAPDGRIVLAGRADDRLSDFAVARLNRGGKLDPTFDGDGRQTLDFDGGGAHSVLVQPNGRTVVVGTANGGTSNSNFALARLTQGGGLDPTFSGDGRQETNFAGNENDALDVALQPDGKIVAAGSAITPPAAAEDFAVARYTAGGAPDSTFSSDGRDAFDFAGGDDEVEALAIAPDGKIVLGGGAESASGPDRFGAARVLPSGVPDPAFSGDGRRLYGFPGFEFAGATGVALQRDGQIVLGGTMRDASDDLDLDLALLRLRGGG